ncbi:MAG TPA: AI-2E family transporter [Phototrophicaceae bacterium]|nr:AI-2E family transporter [Phototrophicaceae bacterium]
MSAQQVFRNTVIVILTVITAYILFLSLNIIVILLFAIIVASAMRPAVLWLEGHKLPQAVSIMIVYVALLAFIFGLFIIVLPPAVSRLGGYVENDDRLAAKLIAANDWAEGALTGVFHASTPITLFSDDSITNTVHQVVVGVKQQVPALAGDAGGLFGDTILVFVIGIYWLTSRDQTVEFTLQLFSLARRGTIRQIILEIEQSLGAYVRGVGLVVLFVGVANFILLTLFHVPNATTLAFIVGVTTALPIIGGYIGAGFAVFVALIDSPLSALLTLLSFVLVQQVETHYLTPRTMSNSVHISPILVIVSLFIGFAVGGVIGGLIAVPIAGSLMVIARYLIIEPKREEVQPQRVKGGILIAGQEAKIDTNVPAEPKPSA